MTAAAPAKEAKSARQASPAPPDEQFWKRYSPHGEAPLSLAGSIALHLLVGGGMVLFAIYLASLFFKPTQSLPVEPVRFDIGGGGGKKSGTGPGKGVGGGAIEDVPSDPNEAPTPGEKDVPKRPALDQVEVAKLKEHFDPETTRFIQKSNAEPMKAFGRLDDSIRRKLADGIQPGKGQGGSGEGGGRGTGKGMGEGSGTGDGKASLNRREKRMLRWHMMFTANSGREYLAQLKGLGAILAIPVKEGADPVYKIVRDLRPGGKMQDEDLSKIQRIYWIDDKPRSVSDVLGALGLTVRPTPSRFVAFMPESLEEQLYKMERDYVERVLRQPFDEDRIDETRFRVVMTGRGYKPDLVSVTMK